MAKKVKITKAKKKESQKKEKTPTKKSHAATRSTRGTATAGGPVTLAEAQALVQAQSPKRARRAKVSRAATVVPSTSPATVGAEREKLEKQNKEEIDRRIREYKATLSIMKQRGVKPLTAKPARAPKRRAPAAAAAGIQPLQVFAEGDSWFEYPVPMFGGGIIKRLQSKLGVPILNLAKAGDEVRFILGVEERKLLEKQLRDGCPAGGAWDVLLFSGGGNDIVGDPMALWIDDYKPSLPAAKLINQPRFDAAMAIVKAGYEDLIGMRDSLSPSTHLVFHAYDFALPDGRGVCKFGPWLKPTFSYRKFPNTNAVAFEVVKAMLKQFAAMLSSLQASHSEVSFVNGQGTLNPVTSSWHNELHPSKNGFEQFADLFHKKLKALFPTRVP
jgi:hypothetical protein